MTTIIKIKNPFYGKPQLPIIKKPIYKYNGTSCSKKFSDKKLSEYIKKKENNFKYNELKLTCFIDDFITFEEYGGCFINSVKPKPNEYLTERCKLENGILVDIELVMQIIIFFNNLFNKKMNETRIYLDILFDINNHRYSGNMELIALISNEIYEKINNQLYDIYLDYILFNYDINYHIDKRMVMNEIIFTIINQIIFCNKSSYELKFLTC